MDSTDPTDHPHDELSAKGWLTKDDRKLLLGKKDYEDLQQERGQRLRMRKRLRGGLKDFWFLIHCLSPEDRRQLVVNMGNEVEPWQTLRERETQGLVNLIAFVYALSHDLGLSFEYLVRQGFDQARQSMAISPFALSQYSVSIETQSGIDVTGAIETIESGGDLTNFEYLELRWLLLNDADVFIEETEQIELPDLEEIGTDDYLPLGESLVYFARVGTESAEEVEPNRKVLHPRVERELLP